MTNLKRLNVKRVRMKCFVLAGLLLAAPGISHADYREFRAVPVDEYLSTALSRAAEAILRVFPRLSADNLALSVIDLTKPERPVRAEVLHGDAPFYPASLVKLFFMVEAFHQGHRTAEIERALREMIQVSDNDAAAFLVDVITETTSGPELEGKALRRIHPSPAALEPLLHFARLRH